MKFVLHLAPAGPQLWKRSRAGWQAHDGPADGPVWLVTDLAEESFAEIQIPRIFGRDRQAFIARQLASRFPDTLFRTTLPTAASGGLMDRIAPPRLTLLGVDAAQRVNSTLDALPAPIAGVWATSMLLALMGIKKGLPTELFVVFPAAQALRIVFIKNRVPVLSRLIPGITQAADQAAEIVRTLRHLENTRVLERSGRKPGVLLLGDSESLAPLLAIDQLPLVAPPAPWTSAAPLDWRFALFDLALTSPVGQLAPLSRRTSYIATRLRLPAYAVAGISLGLALWASAGNLREIMTSHNSRNQTDQRTQQLEQQLNEVAQKMAGFGVPPELVHQAAKLDREELASAPSLATQMQQIAQVLVQRPELRVSQFEWRILQPEQAVCTRGAPAPAASAEMPTTEPATPTRQVEISFDISLPQSQPARARSQSVRNLSALLAKIPGVTLIQDPAKALAQATLSGGGSARPQAEQALSWCLSLPGQPADAANALATTRP
ncbi:MAG: hypothetical protein KJ614_03860 [Gammaproteobacteria bacterium]|uniref:hypothetical protein n=1 Tax=Rhodoferax sp. TaxID=50421 RepID=UPI001803ACFE|nr:hypothetical protein [Rhodoferax sp.]MBU3898054.1 hypothetical protein [Gammaproteobacteria bacterium]MBA3058553.1 hypothetical protein [Rhodoferax sp.]MBU3999189.1 hypothetical protein [Gammaproteobacteria bacterium]MBU4081752.1 hypothetical protein [Gammaproteobacteria bacterium]MBU4112755.1 hypothetical protein [Gammaproteobacteria bacterium]